MPVPDLSRQMARNAAMVGARSARIGMFAEAIGAVATDCSCPWGRRIILRVTAWTRHRMSIAIDVVAAITRLLLRISEDCDTAQNQDADNQDCGLGCGGKPVHAQYDRRRSLKIGLVPFAPEHPIIHQLPHWNSRFTLPAQNLQTCRCVPYGKWRTEYLFLIYLITLS